MAFLRQHPEQIPRLAHAMSKGQCCAPTLLLLFRVRHRHLQSLGRTLFYRRSHLPSPVQILPPLSAHPSPRPLRPVVRRKSPTLFSTHPRRFLGLIRPRRPTFSLSPGPILPCPDPTLLPLSLFTDLRLLSEPTPWQLRSRQSWRGRRQ